jgi:hypothetical protein
MSDHDEDDAILDVAALERMWNVPCDEDEGPYARIRREAAVIMAMIHEEIAEHEAKYHGAGGGKPRPA